MITSFKHTRNGLILVFLSLVLAACGGGQQGPQRGGQTPQIPVLDLAPRSIVLTTTYPTTLEGAQTVEIRPRVQGYIEEMRVDEGDFVNKGQVLFRLNNEQYQQEVRSAKADIVAAQAGVNTSKNEVERLKKLAEQGIISEYRLQDAQNNLESSKATLSQAQAALENAQVNLGYTYVKSPASGVIGNIPYRIGSLVSSTSTQPMTVVSDVSKVYAYFSLSERELLEMTQSAAQPQGNKSLRSRVEDIPDVNLILADGSTYAYKGDVRLASGLINSETGSASFRAIFPNPENILRSGASGSIQIPVDRDSVIVIPKRATYEVQNETFVYTVSDSNKVFSAQITLAPLATEQLYVVDEGLKEGDSIVIAGMETLQDSMRIAPQSTDADSLYNAMTAQDQPENSGQ